MGAHADADVGAGVASPETRARFADAGALDAMLDVGASRFGGGV